MGRAKAEEKGQMDWKWVKREWEIAMKKEEDNREYVCGERVEKRSWQKKRGKKRGRKME